MSARILVVDDIAANIKLLEARLLAEYFDVVTAASGQEVLTFFETNTCDLILLDVMMPGMDGFELCRRLKANPRTVHIPVILITALDQTRDRVQGLQAGADDFLTKPVGDLQLITRVKSLVRLKMLTDEIHARATDSDNSSLAEAMFFADPARTGKGRILLIDNRPSSHERLIGGLRREHDVELEIDPTQGLIRAAEGDFELVIVNADLADHDALRICSQLRSLERTRHLPILLVCTQDDQPRMLRALELGVNDYLVRPVEANELLARCRTQIRRKRFTDRLRDTVQHTMELALTDSLTGLHNRRYFDMHIGQLVEQANTRGGHELALLVLDIDHFKSVNDTYGHSAGDEVLKEFAARIERNLRGMDMACRMGGEEFVIVMPDTDQHFGLAIAERLRDLIARSPFPIGGGRDPIKVTVSIGLAVAAPPDDTPEKMLRRADMALYAAKRDGRNRVVADAA
ncbi:Stalked cell differentiation-controlling protein [Hartmannibacter diazotrophicus]|uniref:diguanylate cyclase n=1 Tax=Hartmannibacter diazotrophicus TaxID=1482074 RepID=A0A2C9D743_9HYPH|nr:PleD family two-component system response regulator [Hartmannibacter diazotrophicus]SON56010.1 Stalked cell differentiation-controlling protein [Hartmannibacter diazotrophicus]